MKSKTARIATVLALGTLSSTALAQDGDRKVIYKQKTEIDFEGLEVAGELVKPQGALLLDRKRANFNQEMAQSVDEIK